MGHIAGDGLISSAHPKGDPVRTCEPAMVPVPAVRGEHGEGILEPATIVLGQD